MRIGAFILQTADQLGFLNSLIGAWHGFELIHKSSLQHIYLEFLRYMFNLEYFVLKVSTVINCVLCILGGVIVFCIICVGFFHVNHDNWTGEEDFFRFGIQGVGFQL